MGAGADTALKDLGALGEELGVSLPLAELTERRTDRVFGFPGEWGWTYRSGTRLAAWPRAGRRDRE